MIGVCHASLQLKYHLPLLVPSIGPVGRLSAFSPKPVPTVLRADSSVLSRDFTLSLLRFGPLD